MHTYSERLEEQGRKETRKMENLFLVAEPGDNGRT